MMRSIKVILGRQNKLVINLPETFDASQLATYELAAGGARISIKPRQRFHLRNHIHYGHHVNLGHQHANSTRVNRRHLLRSRAVEQPTDWLEQIVENKAKMIEMHAF